MCAKLIITACILQGVYLLPVTLDNPCGQEELWHIKLTLNSEFEEFLGASHRLYQRFENFIVIVASSDRNQQLEDAKAAKAQSSESSPVSEILTEADAIVDSLVPGECADLAKLDTGIEKKLVHVHRDNCEAKWKENLTELADELLTIKRNMEIWSQVVQVDIAFCANNNGTLGCRAVESTCQKMVTEYMSKTNSYKNIIEGDIRKVLAEYDKCTGNELGLKAVAESKTPECGVQESEDVSDKPSGPNGSESNDESNDANQPTSNDSNPNVPSDTAESDDIKPPGTSVLGKVID